MTEASAVEARGRISPEDLGIWKDEHVAFLARIAAFVKAQGAAAGVQLAHAGRKASVKRPWEGGAAIPVSEGGWQTVAPSAIPFRPEDPQPHAMSVEDIRQVTTAFRAAAHRVLDAGFNVIELHAAHGYLIHEFLSPLSNQRHDQYGGLFENRIRLALESAAAIRTVWPERFPLFLRISSTDWVEGGWTADDSVELARRLTPLGVDLIDCSSGGLALHQKIPPGAGYQVQFAERIRRESGILTGAVGLITSPQQAEEILASEKADIVLLAREFLRDPYFPLHSGETPPTQYARAF
jgi:2,4-dienoyl-CoA reductase-like NADH-dependent reductase (Old Yellow Enzyme family)